jgi:hypothetical protein
MCGLEIESNPANMCVNCLRGRVDITDGIPKQIIIHQCRGCARYLRPPWVACDLESKELLAICLKKVTGLNKVGAERIKFPRFMRLRPDICHSFTLTAHSIRSVAYTTWLCRCAWWMLALSGQNLTADV